MSTGLEIAVIGMAGRFPGAKNIGLYWENLKNGEESISFFSEEEIKTGGWQGDPVENSSYVKARGIIEGIENFDAGFFEYTPLEAEIMDPQIRLFHEVVWEALEDAGYDPWAYTGMIGLYAGASPNIYWEAMVHLSGKGREYGDFAAIFKNDKDFLSLLLSYKLNLRGPVISFYTACSTSLVAVHLGSRALLTGECHMVLAGGVTVNLPQRRGYLYQEGMILARDGHCRPFDGRAGGTLAGNGAGVVLLKPLAAALAGGDHIYAVIKGSSVTNDGDQRIGFTAPGIAGQAEAIKRALHMAEVAPGSIRYIETHGTGTPLGDPVEIEALKQALKSDKTGYCAIGSVKSNIGHLDCAAGIAGFIKAVLIVQHKELPPSLHYESRNPKIEFTGGPFYVNRTLTPLSDEGNPVRVGVSSFGMGGTNAHVVLEEAPVNGQSSSVDGEKRKEREYQLILLSAKTETALAKMTENLAGYLRAKPGVNLDDVAYTLQVGRKHYTHRRKLICTGVGEAIEILTGAEPRKIQTYNARAEKVTVVFMFPGIGAQYVNMGREIYEKEEVFRREMDRCFEQLKGLMSVDLKEILYPGSNPSDRSDSSVLDGFEVAQVAIFIFEYALARLLMSWGIEPKAMVGYSLGEYTAACIAGVMTPEEALKVIVTRGRLITGVPGGAMLSIPLPKDQVGPLLEGNKPGVALAIDNGPSCIVSGAGEAVAALALEMKKRNLVCYPLKAVHAIHSPEMRPILKDFHRALENVSFQPVQIPYISNVSGTWIRSKEAADPAYWTGHLAGAVQFAGGIRELSQQPNPVFIEVGPGRDLGMLLTNQPADPGQERPRAVSLVQPSQSKVPGHYYLMSKVGQLWHYGVGVRWENFYPGERRHRLSMPTYPFDRQNCPVEIAIPGRAGGKAGDSPEEKKPGISDWFYYPSWSRIQLSPGVREAGENGKPGNWLVFALEKEFCTSFIRRLRQEGNEVIEVARGEEYAEGSKDMYTLNPADEKDYDRLMGALGREEKIPQHIVHFWSMGGEPLGEAGPGSKDIENALNLGYYSLVNLAKALGRQKIYREIRLQVITAGLRDVTGEEAIQPQQAPLLGPLKVIPQEYPFIRCQEVDIQPPGPGSPGEALQVKQLLEEAICENPHPDVAYRNNYRWEYTYRPIRYGEVENREPRLKERGVYMITGGFGKIGLTLAGYLAERVKAGLVLVGREALPAREQWEEILANAGAGDPEALKIRAIQQMEARGARVLMYKSDVADREAMEAVVAGAEQQLGPINGVIHAAGDTGQTIIRSIEHLTPADSRAQFQSKIYGLITLEQVLRGKKLDFCWLTSSLSPVLGGLGLTAYAAANHFMDAFVQWKQRGQTGSTNGWISVNWADWKFTRDQGKSEKPGGRGAGAGPGENREERQMLPGEGIETFRRILAYSTAPRVAVSTVDLPTRLERWVTMQVMREDTREKTAAVTYRARPHLETNYVKPVNRVEQAIAGVIQDFLGIEEVGTQDNFFELGATSLNIIRINSIAREKLHREISVMWWFEYPTIKSLAGHLQEQARENPGGEEAAQAKEEEQVQAVKKGKNRLDQLKKRAVND